MFARKLDQIQPFDLLLRKAIESATDRGFVVSTVADVARVADPPAAGRAATGTAGGGTAAPAGAGAAVFRSPSLALRMVAEPADSDAVLRVDNPAGSV
jgi:hypothetical protein